MHESKDWLETAYPAESAGLRTSGLLELSNVYNVVSHTMFVSV